MEHVRTAQPWQPHRQPRLIALVALGGLLGTPARYAVEQAEPTRAGHWPTATFVVNLGGAFALGFLLEALQRQRADVGRSRQLRLLLGTGFLASFTTYSTFAVEADLLVREHHGALAGGYAAATLVGGICATVAGLALAGRTRDETLVTAGTGRRPLPVDPDVLDPDMLDPDMLDPDASSPTTFDREPQ